jgi:hypothetical protein
MKPIIFFLIAICCIVFNSCQKRTIEFFPVSPDLKRYFDYQPGSYWVYRDSTTGASDSVYVYAHTDENLANTSRTDDKYTELIVIDCVLHYGQTAATDTFHFYLSGNVITIEYNNKLSGTYRINYALSFPFVVPQYNNSTNTNLADFLQIIPDFEINGQHFYDVLEVHAVRDDDYAKFDDWLYVNKDQGLVRIRWDHPGVSLTRSYKLKSWNIIR